MKKEDIHYGIYDEEAKCFYSYEYFKDIKTAKIFLRIYIYKDNDLNNYSIVDYKNYELIFDKRAGEI